jgi:hypothetical protein
MPCCHDRMLATDPSGRVYEMPEDFAKLLKREHVAPTSTAEALKIAAMYIELTGASDPALILSNIWTIPGIGSNPPKRPHIVNSPTAEQTADGFKVRLFSWSRLGGSLDEWHIMLSLPNGAFSVERITLERWIGESTGYL